MAGMIGPCGAYRTVQDEGVALTRRRILDFAGAGVTATDDAAGERTLVTIPGGGSGGITSYAYVSTLATQTIPNGAWTTLAWDITNIATGNISHSNVTNNSRLTVAAAGYFSMMGNCQFDSNATGARFARILDHNGPAPVSESNTPAVSGFRTRVLTAGQVWFLAASGYVEMQVYQTSGGNLDIPGGFTDTPCWFSMFQIA